MSREQNNREIGGKKEGIARWFLQTQGYEIIESNYRCTRGEVDIICKKDGYLIFVEVKYRRDVQKGSPAMAVDAKKQQRICQTARWYLHAKHYKDDYPCRFDVVEILGNQIRILEDAFDFLG